MVLDTIDIGVKIIVGTIHELSLQEFGGYAHLITTRCLLVIAKITDKEQLTTD
ncbi:MAG: hypothetical protein ACLBM6_20600 [Cuspidothrix sp.]